VLSVVANAELEVAKQIALNVVLTLEDIKHFITIFAISVVVHGEPTTIGPNVDDEAPK